jgi:hypothetical protein
MTEQNKPERQRILEEAIKCVTRDRNASYGSPEDNFNHIADLWNAQLKSRLGEFKFTALDVAVMFCLMKIARIRTSPDKDDNYIDLAGYAACAADCATPTPPKIKITPKVAEEFWAEFRMPGHMELGLQGEKND